MKRIKFNDRRIQKLFDMLNSDVVIRKINVAKGERPLHPINIEKSFKNPEAVKQLILPEKRSNAFIVIDAGHELEDGINSEHAKTKDERTNYAIQQMTQLIQRINDVLQASSDPLFSQLEAEAVNKSFSICRTYIDPHGYDDHFGMEVFICIHYKKGSNNL